ncbi:biotin-independent malonate decarboxylase subunit beta [Lactiplantibacillus pentosus]|jgi:malonate decarboxylase beta subunit|uniref:Malonate decarboxylase, beta subunit n=2 Tax=Lactiplantibacillus pentosus TaxID=1589 RepID=G0LZP8_LACPE|nr:biotin-independent malonate decarboxylase subunit beta [Lactiplantibacillus pentosus]CCC18157.1 malonate decarboxylase, beta subunit [Lactiplantibacillus pentosus IG1]MCT3284591.1 biotin-independent malonate decarboxylase subunit beta [Lactiplantibacillus pentosus]MCT3303464.1 biotin-independent malonate decarboxylase subunit beta [Lactiplantibacillus pentosus]PRO79787.1 biotin-independent malonate decarboxylase subunit beta [Lactiplantibacillus pentosus]PRO80497.1 biotin-independent malona
MSNSFVELHARQRAEALLDAGSTRELIGPLDNMISPHLEPQQIVPESDDGVVIMKGRLADHDLVVIAIEGAFQGGGIGEVSGAKIVAALEHALADNQAGHRIYPVIILDTGGVRLQEANYGLLSISEIHNMVVALKKHVPVIGLVPGRVGSFGGMSITNALLSYVIGTNQARIGLNGPEVIEQEAGVREWDASDKNLIWDTLGTTQRQATGIIDEVIEDDVTAFRDAVSTAIATHQDSHRDQRGDFYLSLLDQLDPSEKLTIPAYDKLFKQVTVTPHHLAPATSGENQSTPSRGRTWFENLTGITNAQSDVSTVLHAQVDQREYIAIVADAQNRFPRVRHGEVGLQEGYTVASVVNDLIAADADKTTKTPIIMVVDVPSQAYGYNEELIGIHMALAASASAYARARQAGHKVVALIAGDAVSGGFLAHGLQSNRLVAFDDLDITVQAMSKASSARITQRTIAELEAATQHVPAMAYDIENYQKLGALYQLIEGVKGTDTDQAAISKVKAALDEALTSLDDASTDLSFRYTNPIAVNGEAGGRKATNQVRRLMAEQWAD